MKKPPLAHGTHLLSNLFDLQNDPLALFTTCHRGKGGVVRLRFGPHQPYYITHPDHIKRIFQTNASNYRKTTRGYRHLRLLFGDGLITSNGTLWQEQREAAQHDFKKQNIERLLELMKAQVEKAMMRLDVHASGGNAFDIFPEMGRLTISVIDRTMIKMELDPEIDRMQRALHIIYEAIFRRMTHVVNFPLWLPTRGNKEFIEALEYMRKTADAIIARHRHEHDSFIARIANLNGKGPSSVDSDKRKRDAVLTYLVTGHETTAITLTWLWYLLSLNPEVEQILYDEIAKVLSDKEPTIENLRELKYADQVILETLRLYPPVWNNARESVEKDEIGGYPIPPKKTVIVNTYAMHRMPEYWDRPDMFDPKRFESTKLKSISPYIYFPFGLGPRTCIGANFALQEIKLVLVMVLRKFKLRSLAGNTLKIHPLLGLSPQGPVMMKVFHRP